MLFVFDTNTLLSALLKPEGIPARALAQAIKSGKLLFSEETKQEYLEVIAREKFTKYLPTAQRLSSGTRLLAQAEYKMVSLRLPNSCTDTDDIKFLELALAGKADTLISGDKHLLTLHPFQGIPIVSPADFLKKF